MEGLAEMAEAVSPPRIVQLNRKWSMEQRLVVAFLIILAAVALAGMAASFMA